MKNVRVGLGNNITTFRCHHHPLGDLAFVWIFNGFQETSWNTSGPFDARLVVEFAIAICWAILYPMTYEL
jgi:hypothetical protein